MIHMLIGKRCHSVIAMVVVGLVADLNALHVVLGCRLFEVLGEKLPLLVEVVAGSLVIINICPVCICIQDSVCIWEWLWTEGEEKTYNINQYIQRARPLLEEFCGIVLFPFGLLVLPEVSAERLLAPRAVDRVRNGCECRDGLVFAGVTEELHPLALSLCRMTGFNGIKI